MFATHSAESDWEWAAQRRTLFKTPKVGVLTGLGTFALGILVRGSLGEPNWFRASVIPALVAAMVAVVLPQIETFMIWRRRHAIRLDEAKEQLAAMQAPTPSAKTLGTPSRPRAEVTFDCDRTGWARLRVTNTGAGATFTVTIQLHGLTAGAVEGRQIFGKWELGNGAHQRLAAGETRAVRLATVTHIAPGVRGWLVHQAEGNDIGGVELVEFMEVRVVADPDLIEPCHLQVLLDATGESKMARIGLDPPLFRNVVKRVEDMRRLLVEIVDYVRGIPKGRGNAKDSIWMAVIVHEKVGVLLATAFGPRMLAVYATKLKEAEGSDLREACAAFLLDLTQRLTEDQIDPTFPLPTGWVQFYEGQPGWEWPEYD